MLINTVVEPPCHCRIDPLPYKSVESVLEWWGEFRNGDRHFHGGEWIIEIELTEE